MKNKITTELKHNRHYLFMSISISVLTMLPQIIISHTLRHAILLIVTTILLVLISKFSRVIFAISILYINITNIIIGHINMHWGYANADISPRIYMLALSPDNEILEYLKTQVDYKDILLTLYTVAVLYLLLRFVMHFKHTFRLLKIVGISFSLLLIIGLGPYFTSREPFDIAYKLFTIPANIKYKENILERKEYLKSADLTENPRTTTLYDKIVVIIGESVNKHHMGIYGYNADTTPFLSSILKAGNLYRFNAISPANLTNYSVSMIMTKANVNDFIDQYTHSVSIVTDFRKNGYATYWLSNQGRSARGEGLITSIAEEADTQIFKNSGSYFEAKTDNDLLEYLKNIKSNDSKEMYVIHLIGSHSQYSLRYTKEHSLYSSPENLVQDYDNTIFYTDRILKQIYEHFNNKKSRLLLIYLSDHGEVVNTNKYGHGFTPAYKDEYDVPLIVYSNIKNTMIDELYSENDEHYFNTESFNHFIKYISGISENKNISSSSDVFTIDPKNISDYDKLNYYR